jgi:GMP synthase-like glutamine amidotransferase
METVKVDVKKVPGFHLEEDVFSAYHLNGNGVSLPKGFVGVGKSKRVKNEMMVHSGLKVMGFQFHPEYVHGSLIQSFVQWAGMKG